MKKITHLIIYACLALAFGLMLSCSNTDDTSTATDDTSTATDDTSTATDDTSTSTAITVSGSVQKGPYVQGTEITVRELDSSMIPTGNTFTGTIDDNTGSFSIKGTLTNKIVELSALGYYFNEVSGSLSSATLTLSALSDLTDISSVNVNLMTHLEKKRVEYLIDNSKMTFAAAKTQAQTEIMKIFNIDNVTLGNSETLDISKSGDGNAVLLAISAILQSDKTEAELTELLSTINTDIRTDGTLDSTNTKATLVAADDFIKDKHSYIRNNIETRYSNLGVTATIPSFESYVCKLTTEVCPVTPSAISSNNHTCVLISDGTIKCWGNGGTYRLGNGSTSSQQTPVLVSNISNATIISAGAAHTCSLISGGTIKCWGQNTYGQLGNNASGTTEKTPVSVSNITSATSVSSGGSDEADGSHTCALLSDGTIKCWGEGNAGQLGNGSNTDQSTPVSVSNITNATVVSAGESHTCALLSDGTIKCWGYGRGSQLGNGSRSNSNTPVQVSNISNAIAISVGKDHNCALISGGTIECWGWDIIGGGGTDTGNTTSVSVSNISSAISVSAGSGHTCAVLSDATIKCWGQGDEGQLGNGLTTDQSTPVSVSNITNATAVSAGMSHTCALLSDNTIKCWGSGSNGNLGNGSTAVQSTPVYVTGFGV